MSRKEDIARLTAEVTKKLTDDGKLIEAGFEAFRLYVISPDAPQVQIDEMRLAFMAGAQHLFGSMNSIMEEDREPTENDMRRMELIHREMEEFTKRLGLRINPTKGSG